jgi:hypothetical protein
LNTSIGRRRINSLLHIACSTRERDVDTAWCSGTCIHASLDVLDVSHREITTTTIHATLNNKGAIGGRVGSTIGCGASDWSSGRSTTSASRGRVAPVDAQGACTSAILSGVSSAWHEAVSKDSRYRSSVRSQGVSTEALCAILQAGVTVTFSFTI